MMLLEGLKKTPFAALSRAICGVRNETLIINFPGSKKAVGECFEAIKALIPHAIELICDDKIKSEKKHVEIQKENENQCLSDDSDLKENAIAMVKAKKDVEIKTIEPKTETSLRDSLSDLLRSQGIDLDSTPATTTKDEKPKKAGMNSTQSKKASTPISKKSLTSSTSKKDISKDLSHLIDLTFKTAAMEELLVDDSLASLSSDDPPVRPKRHVCPHKTANPGKN